MSETTPETSTAPADDAPAAKKAPARKAKADVPEEQLPCPACFRFGWPDGATAVGCEHGSWTRS